MKFPYYRAKVSNRQRIFIKRAFCNLEKSFAVFFCPYVETFVGFDESASSQITRIRK